RFATLTCPRVSRTFVDLYIGHLHCYFIVSSEGRPGYIIAIPQGHVQNHVAALIERLGTFAYLIARFLTVPVVDKPFATGTRKEHTVHMPADFAFFPLNRVGM